MSTAQVLDYTTLKWVKNEIEENLKQTRQALEAYVENPEDSAQLRFCTTYLHQIYGTLQMVEIYGGALLAEEMEQLTLALIDDKVKQKDDAYDVVMRAILQLPSYLEHLEAGEQDRPVILLPLLNDLRAARGETLLSENAFFSPNLSVDAPAEESSKPGSESDKVINLPVYAKKLRSVFQSSLVGLYRGETPKANLRKIGAVFKELLVHSKSANAKRLWWVSGGVIEALFNGGLESNNHVKQLISQIDGEIKRLISEGDQSFDDTPPTELLKNLLFYVATSKSGGKRVDQLKKLFDLESLIPSGSDISQSFERLRGSNQELMDSVSDVIKEDLLQIKDQLDVFVRNEDRTAEQLKPFAEQISRISDTLAMLGLGDLHKILKDQNKSINIMIAGGDKPSEVQLMEIASSLLYIESSLEGIVPNDIGMHPESDAMQGQPHGGSSLPASEQKQLNKLVLKEASGVLARVKDNFNSFANNPTNRELITIAPPLLNQVKGVLAVLMQERPAKLIHIAISYIADEIIGKQNTPNAAALDELADIITSVDYYMEALAESRSNIDSILTVAETSVEKLGYSLENVDYKQALDIGGLQFEDDDTIETEQPVIEAASLDQTQPEVVEQFSEPGQDVQETLEVPQTPEAQPSLELADSAAVQPETPPAAVDAAPQVEANEEIDEEILEIFIEEADEILGSMHDNLSNWKANNADSDSLGILRRSYHTIKGSGRLAGATLVGDFAWSIENMLNKIIEDKLAVSSEILALMDESEVALISLIKQLKGEQVQAPDVAALSARADMFADEGGVTAPVHKPIQGPNDPLTNDAKLVDIFRKEAKVHLETVRNFINDYRQSGAGVITEPLMRAIHTLHGSARVAKAEVIANLSERVDKYITVLYETQADVNVETINLLDEIISVVEPMAKQYDGVTPCEPPANMEDLLERVRSQHASVKEIAKLDLHRFSDDADAGGTIDEDITLEQAGVDFSEAPDEIVMESALDEFDAEPISTETAGDPELVDIFVQEAREILSNIAEILGEWSDNPRDIPVMEELQRTLTILKNSARMANQNAVMHMCAQMDSALSHYVMSTVEPSTVVTGLFQECHAWLESAVANLSEVGEQPPAELTDRLLSISDVEQIQEIDLHVPAGQPTLEIAMPTQEEEIANADQELVAIFLEETAEITQQTEQVLGELLKETDNLEHVTALRRLLHTLKGGARMAGIMSIANVTHSVESVLAQMVENQCVINENTTQLLLAFNEWIHEAVEQVRNSDQVLLPPTKLIHDIENLLQGATLEADSVDVAAQSDEETGSLDIEAETSVPEVQEVQMTDIAEFNMPSFSSDSLAADMKQSGSDAQELEEDEDLIEIFLEEADEIQENIEETLTVWNQDVGNREHVLTMQRTLHTLKGGARMAGIKSVGDLSHSIESLLEDVTERDLAPTNQFPEVVQMCHDWLVQAIADIRSGKAKSLRMPSHLEKRLDNLRQGKDMNLDVDELMAAEEERVAAAEILEPSIVEETQEPVELIQLPTGNKKQKKSDVPVFQTVARSSDEQVRVKADLIDTLVNHAGEMNIYNARIEQQLTGWQFNLTELNQTVQRLHEQLRKFEIEAETQIMYRHSTEVTDANSDFDPLELDRFSYMQQLSRGMVESLGDLHSIQGTLESITSDADVLLLQQSRINTDLHEGLMRTRLTPFSSIIARLRRVVRQTCKEVGKEAVLNVVGADGEIDRSQLNRIVPALEHVLRNAVDHGLEVPQEREQAGKPVEGSIEINFSREGSEIIISISDDGAGINTDLLRKKAVERKLIKSNSKLQDHELIDFILESGFSTTSNVTHISGRGVGMDVVNNEIKQLNGSLHIDTERGTGTTFTIRLPLTVLVNQALMLTVNDTNYALPLSGIEHIIRVGTNELVDLLTGKSATYEYAGNHYDHLHLSHILHGVRQKSLSESAKHPLVLARSGENRVAMHVDQLIGRQEIVIKSVGPQLSSLANISGATILPNGEVALILDVASLIRSSHALQQTIDETEIVDVLPAVEQQQKPLVMVVDDSITVRKVTERLLKRNDFDTITAKDGVDALTVLLEALPDIMLLDVEMPRMDGFELANAMRNDERLKNIPIIMITSRTGEKHRDRALNIGVNKYMGKPYQEQDLIDNIHALLTKDAD